MYAYNIQIWKILQNTDFIKNSPIFRVAKWTINYVNVCIMDTASSQVEVFSICLFSPQTDGEHKQIKNIWQLTCEDVIHFFDVISNWKIISLEWLSFFHIPDNRHCMMVYISYYNLFLIWEITPIVFYLDGW
jgi:hypothetical protein